jgi:hypothetical protein
MQQCFITRQVVLKFNNYSSDLQRGITAITTRRPVAGARLFCSVDLSLPRHRRHCLKASVVRPPAAEYKYRLYSTELVISGETQQVKHPKKKRVNGDDESEARFSVFS